MPEFQLRKTSYRKLSAKDLRPHPKNFRIHGERQKTALSAALEEIGFVGAILVRPVEHKRGQPAYEVLDGHERLTRFAADEKIPCLVTELTDAEADKLLATHDAISGLAGIDIDLLAQLTADIEWQHPALDDMLASCLTAAEELLAQEAGEQERTEITENTPPDPPAKANTKPGDLWLLGNHRLLCGDSTNAEDVARLMNGEKCETVISDPPYGINMDTDYRRMTSGFDVPRTNHQRVKGDDQPFDPTPWLTYKHVVLWGGNCFCSHLPLGTWLVWDKRFQNGKALLSDAEIAWMKGGYGVYVHSVTSQGFVRPEKTEHPTQKPVALMAWCIEKSKATDPILDPYAGSGTTLIAAEQLGRRCFAMEIEPKYCDVAVKRWENLTGQKATREQRRKKAAA